MCLFTRDVTFYEIDIDASCQLNKYGFEISWLWHENTVFYFPTINLCIVVLIWVTFILYSSFIFPLECCFSWHTSWKRCCVSLHMTSRFYEIYIGCIVVKDVYLKLLTWARKCNILFHKNKTILLSFTSFFVKVFTFVSMLAFHIRV